MCRQGAKSIETNLRSNSRSVQMSAFCVRSRTQRASRISAHSSAEPPVMLKKRFLSAFPSFPAPSAMFKGMDNTARCNCDMALRCHYTEVQLESLFNQKTCLHSVTPQVSRNWRFVPFFLLSLLELESSCVVILGNEHEYGDQDVLDHKHDLETSLKMCRIKEIFYRKKLEASLARISNSVRNPG